MSIDCNNKNQMGNVVQSESLQCIGIPSDILNVIYLWNEFNSYPSYTTITWVGQ